MFVEGEIESSEIEASAAVLPVLICPKEIVSDTFIGVPKFHFNVYVFNF